MAPLSAIVSGRRLCIAVQATVSFDPGTSVLWNRLSSWLTEAHEKRCEAGVLLAGDFSGDRRTRPPCKYNILVGLLDNGGAQSEAHGLDNSDGVPGTWDERLECGLCSSWSGRKESGVQGPVGRGTRCGSAGGGGPGGSPTS